jgi:hypothetical protein
MGLFRFGNGWERTMGSMKICDGRLGELHGDEIEEAVVQEDTVEKEESVLQDVVSLQ